MIRRIVVIVCVALASAALLCAQATQPADAEKTVSPGGVTIIKLKPGDGAKEGDIVWVHYTGRLENGTQFDSSRDRGEPISIVLGQGQVIRGWEEGLQGMHVGEQRQLIIPPKLAYGDQPRGDKIPANSTLIFDVELVGLQRK